MLLERNSTEGDYEEIIMDTVTAFILLCCNMSLYSILYSMHTHTMIAIHYKYLQILPENALQFTLNFCYVLTYVMM